MKKLNELELLNKVSSNYLQVNYLDSSQLNKINFKIKVERIQKLVIGKNGRIKAFE